MAPFPDRIARGINEAARAAGFEPFGGRDSWTLMFRSASAALTVAWERGYFHAECEPRADLSGTAIDDDLFRQLVDGDSPHPNGIRRGWTDYDGFVDFLRMRLPEFSQVATSTDAQLKAKLNELRQRRAERVRAWLDSHKAPPGARRAAAKAPPPPSRFWAHAAPVAALSLGVAAIVTLVLLADRYPHRGFEGALGAAWVIVPVTVTIIFLVARNWRDRLNDSRRGADDSKRTE